MLFFKIFFQWVKKTIIFFKSNDLMIFIKMKVLHLLWFKKQVV